MRSAVALTRAEDTYVHTSLRRFLSMTAAAVLTTTGLTALTTTSAHADIVGHCYGNRVAKHRMELASSGKKKGRVELWYSSRSGGTSCVMTYHGRSGRTFTGAWLQVKGRGVKQDRGVYRYYAGGVRQKHTRGHCVMFGGWAGHNKRPYASWLPKGWVHPKTGKRC